MLDSFTFQVGKSRPDIVSMDLEPLRQRVGRLEKLADELMASLNPSTQPMFSRPNRAGVYRVAGFLSNFTLGFLLGCLTFTLFILVYLSLAKPELLKMLLGG
ncbi:MAG: tetrahydromethanopterin S-methyltransferase subunit B [Candidatus Hecatellales archaeon]|nr:MAG: tetrahydromethanopterin S-methyltransferase subunit B [Candidatus Hecatellales archaeon]